LGGITKYKYNLPLPLLRKEGNLRRSLKRRGRRKNFYKGGEKKKNP